MKRKFLFFTLLLSVNFCFAQKKWFKLYTDSVSEIHDANRITEKFITTVEKISPTTKIKATPVLNTSPYLIYYDGRETQKTINLPIWKQVIEPQKQFFYQLAGNETEGQRIFGLFFNGFYLPHELGHALQLTVQGKLLSPYADEFFANQIAILWWRKQGRLKELEQCYQYAKKMYQQLPNPVPKGQTIEEYFEKNYEQASKDPFVYGYMQFGQFISVYEDKSLTKFNDFVKQFIVNYKNK